MVPIDPLSEDPVLVEPLFMALAPVVSLPVPVPLAGGVVLVSLFDPGVVLVDPLSLGAGAGALLSAGGVDVLSAGGAVFVSAAPGAVSVPLAGGVLGVEGLLGADGALEAGGVLSGGVFCALPPGAAAASMAAMAPTVIQLRVFTNWYSYLGNEPAVARRASCLGSERTYRA